MCGIAGIYQYNRLLSGSPEAEHIVHRMLGTMVHRGPDASGIWTDPQGRCVIGHRRLSIIDVSDAGRQPMATPDGRLWITFNGEIYNFRELRDRLSAVGIHAKGRTDTEILLLGLREWGEHFLPMIDGMFAFAAFDTLTGDLLLARDAFGEKPLYYTRLAGGMIAFASELQALETLPAFNAEISIDAMAEVLMFQYIGAPRSIYREVEKLAPGHWMKVSGTRHTSGRYFEFSPGTDDSRSGRPIDDLTDELEELLLRSIKRRLISDVPLGAFLSGGVDSSTVCALVRKRLGEPLKTFSMGFSDSGESEHDTARRFAEHLGTEHNEQILTPDSSGFLETIGAVLDEPNADSSCLPTYLLARFAREQVTVAISGDGGDELFLGYGRYLSMLDGSVGHATRGYAGLGDAYYSDRILVSTETHIQALFGAVPTGLAQHLGALRSSVSDSILPLHGIVRKTDLENYMPGAVLPKMDRMSMRHSLEVRTPFLNIDLARFAESLSLHNLYSHGVGKLLLRRLASRYLPDELINLPKRGFAIPTSQWAPRELLGLADKMLSDEDSRMRSILGESAIRRFIGPPDQLSGHAVYRLWGLLMLESWLRNHRVSLPRIAAPTSMHPAYIGNPVDACGSPTVMLHTFEVAPGILAATFTQGKQSAKAERLLRENDADLLCLYLSMSGETQREPERELRSMEYHAIVPGSPPPDSLTGSTLLVLGGESIPLLGTTELHWLQRGGVREVIAFDPFRSDGQILRLRIRPRDGIFANAWNRVRLSLDAIKVSKAAPGTETSEDHSFRLLLPCQTARPGENLYAHYAIYADERQMPPLPVRTEDIQTKGDGRYCIFTDVITASMPLSVPDGNCLVARADPVRDRYFTEQLAAPIPAASAGSQSPKSRQAGISAPSKLEASSDESGLVLLAGSLHGRGDIAKLAKLIAEHSKTPEPIYVLSMTEIPSSLIAEIHALNKASIANVSCLGGQVLASWLGHLPASPLARSSLWPRWNRYGSMLAILAANFFEIKPRLLIGCDHSATDLIHALVAVLPTLPQSWQQSDRSVPLPL